jgi:hypothetical protein
MTYIEFYDSLSIVNICACLVNVPERVVLIGGNNKKVIENMDRYRRIFRNRGHDVEFIHRPVKDEYKNNLPKLIDMFYQEIETYGDCAVDLTGGDSLYLVAMGAVYQKCKDRNIQLHMFNLRNNTIYDCDQDGQTIAKEPPLLSVEENIRLYGGDIVYETDSPNTTRIWDMTEDFEADIDLMWEICRRDPKQWNVSINVLMKAQELFGSDDDPELEFSIQAVADAMGEHYDDPKPLLEELYRKGILYFYYATGDTVTLIYKDPQTRECLAKAGNLLEMKVYRMLRHTPDKDGTPMYNDVMQGVYIDWDNWTEAAKTDTANEIDIVAMKGMVPVFISCKNGQVKPDELYKLQSVADRFGQGYAKKILIATSLDDRLPGTVHLRQRAADMKIRIIDDLQDLSDKQIQDDFKKLWK